MSRFNSFVTTGKEIKLNVFEYIHELSPMNNNIRLGEKTYLFIPENENHLKNLFQKYHVDEIGFFDNSYLSTIGRHWVVLAEKKVSM
jgi:hypothetical protein